MGKVLVVFSNVPSTAFISPFSLGAFLKFPFNRSEEQRVVSPLLKANQDVFFLDEQGGAGIDEISEYMSGVGFSIPVAQFAPEQALKAACHEGELEIKIDLHRHRGRQGVHVKEINSIGKVVFNNHPLGIMLYEFWG